jgi:hypothetical protein
MEIKARSHPGATPIDQATRSSEPWSCFFKGDVLDANGVKVQPSARKEAHNATATLRRDREQSLTLT